MQDRLVEEIFSIGSDAAFRNLALQIFELQYNEVPVYSSFCNLLGRHPKNVVEPGHIPFLPIEAFRKHIVLRDSRKPALVFESSGTTSSFASRHFVAEPPVYQQSFERSFRQFVADPEDVTIFALLPSYLDRPNSSLIYMVGHLLRRHPEQKGGFYNGEPEKLLADLRKAEHAGEQIILIGVSFALLDFARNFPSDLSNVTIIETGGMKGRGPEITRDELHSAIRIGLRPKKILSEYGMTELLSQGWLQDDGLFHGPPWMRIQIRDLTDPFTMIRGRAGGMNIIDLANIHSCSFIATSDIGISHPNGGFDVLGRVDDSDIRGCNLLYQET